MKLKTREEKQAIKRSRIDKRNTEIINFLVERMKNGWKISESIEVAADKFCLSTQTIWNVKREASLKGINF